jgi:hypothetical protein
MVYILDQSKLKTLLSSDYSVPKLSGTNQKVSISRYFWRDVSGI